MTKSGSTSNIGLPSKADSTSLPIESTALDYAKTLTKYPKIYYQLGSNRPYRWVKKNGTHIITNPSNRYRHIQNQIKQHLERYAQQSTISLFKNNGGYKRLERLRGFYDVLVVDLRATFESITYTRVTGLLRSRGLEPAAKWARYCVFNGSLARGSICSNQILESLLIRLDYRLAGLARLQNLFLKRYCDEYWFYGEFERKNIGLLLSDVTRAVSDEGFALNTNKTRLDLRSNIEALHDPSDGRNQSRGGFLWAR